jgi:hypothetical protein
METKRIESPVTITGALVGCLFAAYVLCGAAPAKIEPTGASVGAVQFDTVIELNRYSARSLRHDYTVIFARYWVAPGCYSAAVVWAEPQSTDMFFAVHPAGLSVASSAQVFEVSQGSTKKENAAYKKPLGERGVFRYMFGSYPIGDIRFAEQEALARRIYGRDVKGLSDANQTDTKTLDLSIPAGEAGAARDVARLRVQATGGGRIDSMDLLDAKQRLLKSMHYEYANKDGKPYLRREIVTLAEQPMMVGFKGDGITVTLDGKKYHYRDLEVKHHAGGRTCTVEYEPVTLGKKKVSLPVRVTVRGGKDNQILRSAHLMNFKQVELDAAGAEKAARQFAKSTDEESEYRKLRSQYWGKDPNAIDKADVEAIGQLRARIEKETSPAESSTGEKLKCLNILMDLSLILGDVPGLERHYECYLSTLHENKLSELTLVGGYGVIETTMFRHRRNEAGVLLNRWVNTVVEINDAPSILLFAKRQLAKKRLWPAITLLQKLSTKHYLSDDDRFEAEALRCTALDELCKLMRSGDVAKKGLIAEVQADWAASVGKEPLEKMLAGAMSQARRSFTELNPPTQSERALMKRLDPITVRP